jgi:large conductance mechanosensitive channel
MHPYHWNNILREKDASMVSNIITVKIFDYITRQQSSRSPRNGLLQPYKRSNAMKIIKEFKEFAMRGSVLDLAIGIIIGGAFGKVVSSVVNDLLMPPLGVIMGGVDFSFLGITIREATTTHPAAVFRYGVFINNLIDFTIVTFAIFLLIKAVNRIKRKDEANAEAAVPTAKICPECFMSIPIEARRCGHCTSVLK